MQRRDNPIVFLDVTIGGQAVGRLLIELRADVVPKTAENFRRLCTGEREEPKTGKRQHLARCPFHRVVRDQFCQSGDYAHHDGSGGECTFNSARQEQAQDEGDSDEDDAVGAASPRVALRPPSFEDENFILRHSGAGVLSMANSGPDSNTCQFYLHFAPRPDFDGKHVVFGCLLDAESLGVLELMNRVATVRGDPKQPVKISRCGQLFL